MLNPCVALLYKNLPDKYPHVLARNYMHVLNRLMQLWTSPEFDDCMLDLLIDKRGGRKGFSHEALAELMFLYKLHSAFKQNVHHLPEAEDPWKAVLVQNPSPKEFLHAIERGQLDAMKVFLNAGVTIDYRFEGNQTPLMIAVISGQLDAARCLIEDGAGINLKDCGDYTALHWAAFYGRCRLVEELIRAGAEPDVTQNSGDTPLGLAVMRSHSDIVRLLLKHGADPDIAGDQGTPLAIAQKKNNQELIALLNRPVAA